MAKLKQEAEGFRLMAECSLDVLCLLTVTEMACTYCSPSSARVLGWTPDEMRALFPRELIHPDDAPCMARVHARLVSEPEYQIPAGVLRVRRKDGAFTSLEVNTCLMRDAVTQDPWQVLVNMRDISERALREERLEALALMDPLTGLGNRRAFDQALEREWRRARRERGMLSLLMMDVDDFKGVNDRYGHQAGDACLRTLAMTIAAVARRPGDLAARYGGEEFALILPATGADGASLVAEQLRSAVEALSFPHVQNLEHGSVATVSIGCATALMSGNMRGITAANLLKAADTALYQAKQLGRNRVETAPFVGGPL